jgi:serine/threonine protein kinase/tetratricopeptide (TPR) repeat protein
VADKPEERTPRARLRALADWLRGATSTSDSDPDLAATPARGAPRDRAALPRRIGHYAITGKLGQGGMGIVYSARDERLERAVALKTMSFVGDDSARKRFWREARAAARVNHPNICQLYEIDEDRGELFIAMELLEGESLGERLRRGALSVSGAVPIAASILGALQALHTRGIVHRDLKPSNVFLTPHGVKLLDFGLARPTDPDLLRSLGEVTELTRTGMVMGTPKYMAPEQVTGDAVDARSDLFAVGAILFEMLAGRPAFSGRNVVEVLHATLYEQPPALTGSPAVAAVDRLIRRALAKRPEDRPASAEAMAKDLLAIDRGSSEQTPALARAMTRLVVLPFRMLRADPDTDFLAFSLPDAIATSLSGIGSLIVRSSATAARFAGDAPDLKALAAEADVDRVVMGTLLRSGEQLRATVQLVEAPAGTLLTSQTVQASLGDLFRLQDDITHRVVEGLALPLGVVEASPTPDAPHNAPAYALYLRANELARRYDQMPEARELYQRCLDQDPRFAPAWAQLGRCHWIIGKYVEGSPDSTARAEEALRRALELNPRLSVAHKIYAHLESDAGQGQRALVRLLREAASHGNDPELFAGLVQACRYCGLYEQAVAAHDEARRLDPDIPTSIAQTLLMMGEIDRLLSMQRSTRAGSGDGGIRVIALGLTGRRDEARSALDEMRNAVRTPAFRSWTDTLLAWLDRRPADMLKNLSAIATRGISDDPEAMFQVAWLLCEAGELEWALTDMRRAVDHGYFVAPTVTGRPEFDAVRGDPRFQELLALAQAGREQALRAFREASGEGLLGS